MSGEASRTVPGLLPAIAGHRHQADYGASDARARKIAAITLTPWKKGENFDAEKLESQAA